MGLYEEIEKSYPRIMKTLSKKDLFIFKNTDSWVRKKGFGPRQ